MGTAAGPAHAGSFTFDAWKTIVWRQFGAAIDMLENAIDACPDHVWFDPPRPVQHQYWYFVYHTLFWLDFDLAESKEGFAPPAPYTMGEMDPAGVYPDRVYSKGEMKLYLEHGRAKCRATIAALTEERAAQVADWRPELTVLEQMLYSMRHVQHHSAQLNLLLRQSIDSAPRWVKVAKTPLSGA